jgi:hypothetical protein
MEEDPQPQGDPPEQGFVDTMFELAAFLQAIQEEISIVLIQHPKVKKRTEATMKRPDHEILESLDKAIREFLLAMPTASLYGVNLIIGLIQKHSSITGNPIIINAFAEVNKRIKQLYN